MTIPRFWRLRKLIRDTTRPIPQPIARKWDNRLQRIYNVLAFSCFVLTVGMFYRKRKAEVEEQGLLAETDAEYYVRTMNLKDVNVRRFTLMGKTLYSEKIKDADDFKQKRIELAPGASRVHAPAPALSELVDG